MGPRYTLRKVKPVAPRSYTWFALGMMDWVGALMVPMGPVGPVVPVGPWGPAVRRVMTRREAVWTVSELAPLLIPIAIFEPGASNMVKPFTLLVL